MAAVVVALAAAATGLAGPAAGSLIAGYTGLAARGLHQHRLRQAHAAARADLLERLAVAASNLRAGLPPMAALAAAEAGTSRPHPPSAASSPPASSSPPATGSGPTAALSARLAVAVRLAERTGAPLADVLERIEVDGRSADSGPGRGRRADRRGAGPPGCWPDCRSGGVGLGYAIGADPLAVLLHTPLGAVCAVTAIGLQLAGLAWSARITRLDHQLPI